MGVVVNPIISILYDANGVAMAVQVGAAIPGSTPAIMVAGSDGTDAHYMRMASDGTIRIDPTGTTTQPISVASLPLPAGAATAALQTQPGVDIGDVTVNNGAAGAAVNIQDGGNSITVDATSLPLPTGAATEATLLTMLTLAGFQARVNTLGQKNMANSTPFVIASDQTVIPISDNSGSLTVDAVSWPLPTGAATEATLVLVKTNTDNLDVALSTRATESTVATLATQTTAAAIQTVLEAIRDTAGIKKITDPLPAGTNLLGSVDVAHVNGVADATNSSTTPLGSSAAFTGTAFDTLNYPTVVITVKADQVSATDGLSFQWSPDGSSWDVSSNSSVLANAGRGFHFNHRGRYFRVVYTNGASAQGTFRLGVIHRPTAAGLITKPLDDGLDDNNFAQTVRAVVSAKTPSGSYVAASFDEQGRFVVASPGSTAAQAGFSDGQIVLASTTVTAVRSTTYTEQTSNAQRSIVSANVNDTAAGTGARTLRVTYYALSAGVITGPFTETVTLDGTTPVDTVATDICFIEEISVLTVGSSGSNTGIISLKAATAGGGATVWSIAATANQTYGAHHYVPNDRTCNITGLLVGIKGADTTGGFLRHIDPTDANAAEHQVSDNIRVPSSGQNFRTYGTPIAVAGPARLTGYVAPDSTSSRTYYLSFDFYEE
jgi:hypothetical protein